ncbi:MAG: hypothetical protein CSA18_04515 [Deltaproteobacteria bacterium]|nr:MAG: hypothetical protein CSB21_01510 [Deltaproteobacteria bacterium]PIE74544.1 MAG: hypothetical protein CSA18_04515 [Deltaproteobacteria bacterium]
MFFKKFFKKKKESRISIGLTDLMPGDMVDFDMKTWEVTARHKYDWEGDITLEWQIKSSDDMLFIALEDSESSEFSMSRKISNSEIDNSVFKYISENDDAPQTIRYNNDEFSLDEISSGYFYENSEGEGAPLISYDYTSSSGENFLSIEQWGEKSFEVFISNEVFEYQFTNFLPGSE